VFAEDGSHVPVDCHRGGALHDHWNQDRRVARYDALQLGFGAKKKNVSKPAAGCSRRPTWPRWRSCARCDSRRPRSPGLSGRPGAHRRDVRAGRAGRRRRITKGKGLPGGVKRYGWYGGDATHGSMFHRAPGSIGASSDPSGVWPGHHLPGRMGGDQRTVLNIAWCA